MANQPLSPRKNKLKSFSCDECKNTFEKSVTFPFNGKILCPDCKSVAWKSHIKEKRRLENYGLTTESYNSLVEKQNGKCAICKIKDFGGVSNTGNKYELVVDHCHTTGEVRGLLCSSCNKMLGMFKDDPNTMVSAIEYLAKSQNLPSWDQYFINIARMVATRSKDPSTKVGAVIVKDKRIVSTGYNGFPESVPDHPDWLNDRERKYSLMIHAETNAILMAKKYGLSVQDCELYVTLLPCCECAKAIVQAGIKSVKCLDDYNPRYIESFNITKKLFDDAGISYEKVSVI